MVLKSNCVYQIFKIPDSDTLIPRSGDYDLISNKNWACNVVLVEDKIGLNFRFAFIVTIP